MRAVLTILIAWLLSAAAGNGAPVPQIHGAPQTQPAPSVSTCARAPTGHVQHTNLGYAGTANAAQQLDLYVPEGPGPFPALLWIHGGAWLSGDKSEPPVRFLADHGYVVASMNYRLSSEARFPAQLDDARAALDFLWAGAETWSIDRAQIAVGGDSAGGHLAALLALGAAADDAPQRVAAAVLFYAPNDFSRMNGQLRASGLCPRLPIDHLHRKSPESRLLGCPLAAPSCQGRAQEANPLRYVDAQDPPFLIEHGARDCVVPAEQSRELYSALIAAGVVDSQLVIEAEQGHDGAPYDRRVLERFLDRQLRDCP